MASRPARNQRHPIADLVAPSAPTWAARALGECDQCARIRSSVPRRIIRGSTRLRGWRPRAMCQCSQHGSVRSASVSRCASRLSFLASAGEKRSRKRSNCLGLVEWMGEPRSEDSHQGAVQDLDGDRHSNRRRPGLLDDPRHHRDQALTAMGEVALSGLAAFEIDREHVVRLRCLVDTHEPVPACSLERRDACPSLCWRSRRGLPTKHRPWHPAEARVPPSPPPGSMAKGR